VRRGRGISNGDYAECFIGRARNNAEVLAAVLPKEGLLAAAARPEQYVCRGDWQDWDYRQHHQLAKKTAMTAT
jgi:hypothetical protein